jgi:hypothetical protein
MHWVIAQAQDWLAREHIANAFGLVLYTDRHSNTAKVLADEQFWRGLHERTGERWPVFVLKRPPGHAELAPTRPGQLPLMVPVWREPQENALLLAQLGLPSTEQPHLVIHSLLDDEQTLVQTIELSEDSVEAAHAALKEALDAATRAIEDIEPANLKSAEGVQAALDLSVTDLKQRRMIRKAMPFAQILGRLLGGTGAQ